MKSLVYSRWTMGKRFSAVLLLLATLTASAGASAARWFQISTPNFTVLTDSNEKQARRIAGQFEQMRSLFHVLLPNTTDDAGSPIIVLALKDRKSFQSLEPAPYLAKGQLDLAGLFLNATDKNYILLRLDAQGEHPFATVYHEYTHFMLRKSPWLPLWLNEGLAEFYQNTDIQEKEVLLGQASADDIYYLRDNRLLPLITLLKVDYKSPYYHEEQKGSVFYAQSWALTHYIEMTDGQKGTHRLAEYAKLLLQGEDSVTAAQHAFGDLNQLQKALESYVHQATFMMFKRKTAITVDTASFQVREVPQPEVDAIRADVLVHNQRTEEAQALLDSTLRDDPSNALAHETMGFLKFREGDIPSAKKWYGEAVKLDSHSFLAHYYYAAMSLQSGDDDHDEAIESSLRTSIKLNPAFAPSYDTLATFYARRHQNLSEAHLLNVQAVNLEPENLRYRINAAEVLAQQQQFPGALGVLKLAATVAKTPDESAMVQSLITRIQRLEAALDRATRNGENATTLQTNPAQGDATKVMVFRRVDGKVIGKIEDAPDYPIGDSTGARHTVQGVLRNISCSYPTVLTLDVDQGGKTITLYTNNYYKVVFTTANYESDGDIKPCTGIEDMKAKVGYAEVSNKNVAGQIFSIELSK